MRILRRLVAAWRRAGNRTKVTIMIALAIMIQIGGAAVVYSIGGNVIESPKIVAEAIMGASDKGSRTIDYTEFLRLVKEGSIKEARISSETVEAIDTEGNVLVLNHDRWLYHATFPKELAEAGVEVKFPEVKESLFATVVGAVVTVVLPLMMLMMFAAVGFFIWLQTRHIFSGKWPVTDRGNTMSFADVAGQEETKFELAEIEAFLRNPGAYERVGARPPRGVLLVGPPGTGKTLLARALAGEAGASFIAVSGSDFSAMFVGVGRNKVEKLFREARKRAPCIVFIDEIDSLARQRGGSGSDVSREQDTTLNQLLIEMDGFRTKDGIIVVAATNRIDVLDPAILRPGRFDRHIHVGLPTLSGRKDILSVHVKNRPLAADVDLEKIARGTPGFSGADLANLVNEAAILAARVGAAEITPEDFEEARDKVIMGLQRRSMSLDEEERRLIAVHEAGHAVLACKLSDSDPVHQATIIPRGRSLGLVMRLPLRDRVTVRRAKLEADLTVLMGGRAAEEIVLGPENITNGASADIQEATRIARSMVSEWGMSSRIGMVRIPHREGAPSDNVVEEEVRSIIDDAYGRARNILTESRAALDALTDSLLEHETLDGDSVRRIVSQA